MVRFILALLYIFFFYIEAISQVEPIKEHSFILLGDIKGRDTGIIILMYPIMNTNQWHTDTAFIHNGKFQFAGKISEPSFCVLRGSPKDGNYANLFLEICKQYISIEENKFDGFKMSGSFTQKQADTLKEQTKIIDIKNKELKEEYDFLIQALPKINDSISKLKAQDKINQIGTRLNEDRKNEQLLFISAHFDSYVSPTYLYSLMIGRQLATDSVESLYNNFSVKIKNGKAGKLISEELNKRRGNIKADNFIANDIRDKEISLNGLNNQYVLLNFWASWCAPCIKEIPDLKRVLNRYNAKGFNIINISLDSKKKDWIQAVKKYEILEFHNVLVNDDIEKKYSNVKQPIPSQLLINREGFIIWNSMNESSQSLEKTLENEFKK